MEPDEPQEPDDFDDFDRSDGFDESDESAGADDQPGQIILETAEPFPLTRRRLPDDPELAGGEAAIVGTFLGPRLISRSVGPEDWTPETDGELLAEPRQILYIGEARPDGTLYAKLGAVIPGAALPHEPWQPAPEDPAILLLGVVVRLAQDRDPSRSDAEEAVDHFATILGRGAVPVVDKLLGDI